MNSAQAGGQDERRLASAIATLTPAKCKHVQPEAAMTAIDILLDRTWCHAMDFLNGLDHRPVQLTATVDELRHRLGAPLTVCETSASISSR